RRQLGGLDDLPALFLDRAMLGEIAQKALELGAVGILQAELARNLACADLSGIGADESDDGVPSWKAIVVFLLHLSTCLSGALLRGRLGRRGRFGGRSLRVGCDRRARLADGIRFRLCRLFRRLLGRGFLRGLGRIRLGGFGLVLAFGLGRLRRLLCSFLGLALAAALGGALVDQRDGFRQRDRVLFLVARDRGIDAACGDIGAVTAALDRDCAKRGVIAELLAGIGTE